jgi:hypothetical protein
MRGKFSNVVVAMLAMLLTSAVPAAGSQTSPERYVLEAPCTTESTIGAAVALADLDAFSQRTVEWSQQMHRIYEKHAFDTWLEAIRLSRTMAKADSRFVDWMDANPASQCYQPVQAKMRTRIVKHAAILRGFARLVMDLKFDEANKAWDFGAQHYDNTFGWWNHLLVLC